jgi:hypothetical protein
VKRGWDGGLVGGNIPKMFPPFVMLSKQVSGDDTTAGLANYHGKRNYEWPCMLGGETPAV